MYNFHFFKKQFSSLALLLLLTSATNGQQKLYDPFFFIQLTDPQLGMFNNNEGHEKETHLMEKAVKGINQLKPDFVVITGDFVHNQKSESQVEEFKRIVSKINPDIPVYYTPGNHDVGQIPDKLSLKKYKNNYGEDRFAFTHKGSVFIGINTSLIKSRMQSQEEKQFKWMVNKLKKSKKSCQTVLFSHYPFYNTQPEEDETYSNIGPDYREKYLTLFEKTGVDAVFSGHLHNNNELKFGNILMITTSALGKPLGNAPSGLRIVQVYNNHIEHYYYDLDELPEFVKFE
jgi:serine/threonine-protein phosphatase CPPED1